MLTKVRALLSYHLQAVYYSVHLLLRKPLANLMTVSVIAIALSLPALFWVVTDTISQLTSSWNRNGTIAIYLHPSLTVTEEQNVLAQIKKTPGVGHAVLKSAQEGLADLMAQEGMQDIMSYLPDNPLPAVINITPAVMTDSPAKLDLLSRQLRAMTHVEQVKIDMEWIGRLDAILSGAHTLSHALLLLLALAVVFIVGNTLRLTIQNRHEEVRILKLIGADDRFITRPFLYAGIWYGLCGAALALILVNIFILSLTTVINKLAVVYQMHYPLTGLSVRQILILALFAIILGWLGAFLSVHRQLAAIEPYN